MELRKLINGDVCAQRVSLYEVCPLLSDDPTRRLGRIDGLGCGEGHSGSPLQWIFNGKPSYQEIRISNGVVV